MAPPVESFPVSDLPRRVRETGLGGKSHKGQSKFDLKKCKLLEMVQYSCGLEAASAEDSENKVIRCWPVVKLFRRSCFSFSFFFLSILG